MPRALRSVAACGVLALVALASCDTGDGTTLKETAATTTLPPVASTPLPSVPLDPVLGGTIGSVAVDTASANEVVADPSGPANLDPVSTDFNLFAPWADGGPIDSRYGCDGNNVAPSISWVGIPAGTSELAISFVDESNLSNGRPFIHWIIAGLDPGATTLAEGDVPVGAVQGLNFFGDVAWAGPCPNPGDTNSYRLTVHALSQQIEVADGTPAAEMLDLVDTVTIGTADLVGTNTR